MKAGTGKSTLVRFIVQSLGVKENDVVYTAFTGKATEVLKKKGNKNAMTLHKLLFDFIPKPDGTFLRKNKTSIEYSLVIVDEVSMVPKTFIDLLFSYKVHIICLGDPFQLPPINKDEDNHLLDEPHIFLEDIIRQAENSEIIQLTMKIRKGEPIQYFKGKDVMVLPKEELSTGMLEWADQVIVGTNLKRKAINSEMRSLLGYEGDPQNGERVICLRNYWDICNAAGEALINGTIGVLDNSFDNFIVLPRWMQAKESRINTLIGDIVSCDNPEEKKYNYRHIEMDKKIFINGEKSLDNKTEYKLGRMKKKIGDIIPKEFDFAYAITCHKAQGSEWDKVVVIEERFPFNKEEHARWLYTACTRASSRLVLIR